MFNTLNLVLRVFAKVIFTDSNPAMATAIHSVFRDATVHLLCTWHLTLNLATNVKGLVGSLWEQVIKKNWKFCKETDLLSRDTFDGELGTSSNLWT